MGWDELADLIVDVFDRHRIGTAWMLRRMDGRLHWPGALLEWLLSETDAAGRPIGVTSVAVLVEAWTMRLLAAHPPLAVGL